MALSISDLKKVRADQPPRILIYGPPGIGKTTLSSEFENPVFLQIEDGTPGGIELNSFGKLDSFDQVMGYLEVLYTDDHDYKTVVIDSVTELQKLVFAETGARGDDEGKTYARIEDFPYGKGYIYAMAVWGDLLQGLDMLRKDRGMTVILIAHSIIASFNDPESSAYDQYQIALHSSAKNNADHRGLIERHMDAILLMKKNVQTKGEDKHGVATTKDKSVVRSPDVSLARGDAKILRPHLSFYGASTVKDFARSLVSKDVTNGLFNRFLILPRFGEVERGPDPDGIMSLPPALKDRLQWLAGCLSPMQLTMAARGDGYPTEPILIPFSPDADELNAQNQAHQRAMLMASETDDALMLWGRFAEQAKRVAMIVAVGRSPGDPGSVSITGNDLQFATSLVTYSVEQFIGMVRRDMVENWIEGNRQKVLGAIRTANVITKAEMLRKVRSIKAREIDEILGMLEQAESIERVDIVSAGRTAKGYRFLRD